MSFQLHQQQPDAATTVLRLEGRLSLGQACTEVEETVNEAAAANRRRLIFDLSRLNQIDSTGIGRLISAHQLFSSSGKRMSIVGVHGGVRDMLRITQLDTVLTLYPTMDAALAAD